ncbi:MAG: hypothetical protein C9356_15850 [Oleiphilus sp.]|nr:MAG: hypothetical protein C9356_15850 [Oleiphilus sp.]
MPKKNKRKRNKSTSKQESKNSVSTDLRKRVNEALKAGDLELTKRLLLEFLSLDETPRAYYLLGSICRELEEYEEALDYLEKGLKLLESKKDVVEGWIYYELYMVFSRYTFEGREAEKCTNWLNRAVDTGDTCEHAYEEAAIRATREDQKRIYSLCLAQYPSNGSAYAYFIANSESLEALRSFWLKCSEASAITPDVRHQFVLRLVHFDQVDEALKEHAGLMESETLSGPKYLYSLEFGQSLLVSNRIGQARDAFEAAELYAEDDQSSLNIALVGLLSCVQDDELDSIFSQLKLEYYSDEQQDFTFCGYNETELGYVLFYRHSLQCSALFCSAIERLANYSNLSDASASWMHFMQCVNAIKHATYDDAIQHAFKVQTGPAAEAKSFLLEDIARNIVSENNSEPDTEHVRLYFRIYRDYLEGHGDSLGELQNALNVFISYFFSQKNYELIAQLYIDNMHWFKDANRFEAAYSLNEINEVDLAQYVYESYLEDAPRSNAAMNNLANIYLDQDRVSEAIDLYRRALTVEPEDEHAARNLKCAQEKLEVQNANIKAAERLKKSALAHWPSLDFNKKKILNVLMMVDGFSGMDELAKLANMERRWAEIHYNKLCDLGMITTTSGGYQINSEIIPLIEKENSHSVAIQVIRNSEGIRYKPVFNSQLEFMIYKLMIGLFPNHLVFPNIALQSIFDYGKMKDVLEPEEFKYYLMASADVCIISTANYLPILCYEVDSPYHDLEKQIDRDEKKNTIFEHGGVPLIRIRPHGRPSEGEIRHTILENTREFARHLDDKERQDASLSRLLETLDAE